MKNIKPALAAVFFGILFATSSFADGRPVSIAKLPPAVTAGVLKHFPGATLLWATKEYDFEGVEYEVTLRHEKAIIKVEVTSTGQIVDMDMD